MIELLTKLADALLNIPPFMIVLPYEDVVHFRGGKYLRTVSNGFFWKIPIYDSIRRIETQTQPVDLPEQSVTTKTGDSYTLSGCVTYEVSNSRLAVSNVRDYDESLQTIATVMIASTVARIPTSELTYDYLTKEVLEELKVEAQDWGIDILSFGLNQFVKCRTYRIIQ